MSYERTRVVVLGLNRVHATDEDERRFGDENKDGNERGEIEMN